MENDKNLNEENGDLVKEDIGNNLIFKLREEVFSAVWKETKEINKALSKREIAERMFDLGAKAMFDTFSDFLKLEVLKDEGLWNEGAYIKSIDPNDPDFEEKKKFIEEKADEEKNFQCKECNKPIGKHNLYWHEGMCNNCFFDKYGM